MIIQEDHLDLTFYSYELGGEVSFRDYFFELLFALWKHKECFSGKRPFGNSGWENELYAGLIKHKLVEGSLDEDDYVDYVYTEQAEKAISKMIEIMCGWGE